MLRYNNHICYVNNINAVSQSFRWPNSDTFFSRTSNLERHLSACNERVKIFFSRNVYQLRENLFDKLNSFGIRYTCEQKLFKNLAKFDFESICVQKETFRDTNTTTWIGNMSRYLYLFLQTLWKNQISSATLILITSLHLFLELLKIQLPKANRK